MLSGTLDHFLVGVVAQTGIVNVPKRSGSQQADTSMATPKYNVTTWDIDKQMWTPQKGVRKGPYSKWGLRKALRALREMGYDTNRSCAYYVLVERYPD